MYSGFAIYMSEKTAERIFPYSWLKGFWEDESQMWENEGTGFLTKCELWQNEG